MCRHLRWCKLGWFLFWEERPEFEPHLRQVGFQALFHFLVWQGFFSFSPSNCQTHPLSYLKSFHLHTEATWLFQDQVFPKITLQNKILCSQNERPRLICTHKWWLKWQKFTEWRHSALGIIHHRWQLQPWLQKVWNEGIFWVLPAAIFSILPVHDHYRKDFSRARKILYTQMLIREEIPDLQIRCYERWIQLRGTWCEEFVWDSWIE